MQYPVSMAGHRDQTGGAVQERVRSKQDTPKQYNVVLLNDDYSTMDFVVHILESVFQKSPAEAYGIMMQVHVNGRGLAGVYTHEIAETKVDTVATLARDAGYPLRAVMEEA
jgi:ATP-dependent Clp protease adaptor protein ClpS